MRVPFPGEFRRKPITAFANFLAASDWRSDLVARPMTFAGIQSYQDFILNSYLWLLVGILFRLPTLELLPQFAPSAAASRSGSRWIR
jgi:hypothetical protein